MTTALIPNPQNRDQTPSVPGGDLQACKDHIEHVLTLKH